MQQVFEFRGRLTEPHRASSPANYSTKAEEFDRPDAVGGGGMVQAILQALDASGVSTTETVSAASAGIETRFGGEENQWHQHDIKKDFDRSKSELKFDESPREHTA